MTTATITISCDDCELQHTDACADCLVTFVSGASPMTPSWSTSPRPGPCGCSGGPAWCRASASRPGAG